MINKPNKVILHCSATPDDNADKFGAKEIRQWHVIENGWDDIGYHFIIRQTGVIEKGRPEHRVGAHCYGWNQNSLGVCYIGTNKPSLMQLESIIALSKYLRNKYSIEENQWYCHRNFRNKECPGFDQNLVRMMIKYANKFEEEFLKEVR